MADVENAPTTPALKAQWQCDSDGDAWAEYCGHQLAVWQQDGGLWAINVTDDVESPEENPPERLTAQLAAEDWAELNPRRLVRCRRCRKTYPRMYGPTQGDGCGASCVDHKVTGNYGSPRYDLARFDAPTWPDYDPVCDDCIDAGVACGELALNEGESWKLSAQDAPPQKGSPQVSAPRPRMESGVVQFGEDWPGVFLRGDHALHFACVLRGVLSGTKPSVFDVAVLQGLLDTLSAADASRERDVTLVRDWSALNAEVARLRRQLDAVGMLLSEHGCDCECDCSAEEHSDDCQRCLACRIDAVGRL